MAWWDDQLNNSYNLQPVGGQGVFQSNLTSIPQSGANGVNSAYASALTGTPFGDNYNFGDVGVNPTPTGSGIFGGLFDGFLTNKAADGSITQGWGSSALGLANAGLQGYLGLQQLGLAKDNLSFQKDAFSKQFENQRTLTNTEMMDRQNARVASNPGAYQSTDEYMKANGV